MDNFLERDQTVRSFRDKRNERFRPSNAWKRSTGCVYATYTLFENNMAPCTPALASSTRVSRIWKHGPAPRPSSLRGRAPSVVSPSPLRAFNGLNLFKFGPSEGSEEPDEPEESDEPGEPQTTAQSAPDAVGGSVRSLGVDDVGVTVYDAEMLSKPRIESDDGSIITLFRWPRHMPAATVSLKGSWDGWQSEIPLTQSSPSSDWSVAVPLPSGKVYFKFVVDGRYVTSPSEPVVNDDNTYNNLRVVHASAKFTWPTGLLGGQQVNVDLVNAGFGGAGESGPEDALEMVCVEKQVSAFAKSSVRAHELAVCLPPGEYAYGYVVDGVWKTNPGELTKTMAVHPASDGESSGSKKVNIKKVPQAPAVRVYYSTGWEKAKLRTRWVGKRTGGADREEVKTAWKEVALHQTMARGLDGTNGEGGKAWKYAVVDYIPDAEDDPVDPFVPLELEFYPFDAASKGEDHPAAGGNYRCSFPGGFKLKSGIIRPFNQSILPPMMLVSDIDGTLVSHDDDETALTSTGRFARYWEDRAALTGSFLVFNTGRSFGQVVGLLEQMKGTLPIPDAIITAVGTKIFLLDREKGHRGTSSGLQWTEDVQWASSLDAGWDLEKVRRAASEVLSELSSDAISWLDDGSEHPHRIALSVHVNSVDLAMHLLKDKMEAQGLQFKLIVSGTMEWRYLDCVSSKAGKHAALEHLRSMYGIAVDRCVAAGDSGNDILMLEGENPAIVVGNAQAALMEWAVRQPQDGRVVVADAAVADGVLEGLARLNLY